MSDPYVILGVSRNASEDEIKNAYRVLAKKYHPDNYSDSSMKEYATEKMKEINEAYDTVINERRKHGSNSDFSDVRSLIRNGRYDDAEVILNGVTASQRNAEWYFLKGTVFYNRGWLNDAENCFKTATDYDPSNAEYRAAYNRIRNSRSGMGGGYSTNPGNTSSAGCSGCDMCTGLLCADCCCECMGGDLIRCC